MRIFEKASLLVGVCLMSLSFWIVFNKRNSGGESRSVENGVPIPTAEFESAAESVVIEQSKALGAAKADREARIAADPDAYWDPGRSGREYRAKVMRHKQISQFLTSSRQEDPAYREVMIKLLENGYGLGEWIDFVGLASQFHMPVSLARARLEAEGFLTTDFPDRTDPRFCPLILIRAIREIRG